jgi:hypothetical protein
MDDGQENSCCRSGDVDGLAADIAIVMAKGEDSAHWRQVARAQRPCSHAKRNHCDSKTVIVHNLNVRMILLQGIANDKDDQ